MTRSGDIPVFVYKLALVGATVIWGFSFVVMKNAVDVLEPACLIGLRFFFTALLLTLVFARHMKTALAKDAKDHLLYGTVLGIFNFLGFWIQTIGLDNTTPGKNAFLTATYCVIVPFVYWIIARRRPTLFNITAAVLCVTGVGMVSLTQGSFSVGYGDLMTLLCALMFAIHIACVSKFACGRDILTLTIIQFWVGGILGCSIGSLFESMPDPSMISFDLLFDMFYLVVFASCLALVFQNVALAHVPPAQGSLLLSLESVFGVIFSVIFYGETITFRLVCGFALIFAAILISEAVSEKFKRRGIDRKDTGQ